MGRSVFRDKVALKESNVVVSYRICDSQDYDFAQDERYHELRYQGHAEDCGYFAEDVRYHELRSQGLNEDGRCYEQRCQVFVQDGSWCGSRCRVYVPWSRQVHSAYHTQH